MALALLFPNSNVLFLDAVSNYTQSRNSSISTHPVDASASVSDHIAKSPENFSIQATISSADFQTELARDPQLSEDYNNQLYNSAPTSDINITDDYPFTDILPGFVAEKIFNKNSSEITGTDFRGYLHEQAKDLLDDAWDQQYNVTLLDYNWDSYTGRNVNIRLYDNLFITNLTSTEDIQTGDAYEFTISFQKVRFALLKEVDITVSKIPDATAKESNQGNESNIEDSGNVSDEKKINTWNREGGFRDQMLSVFPDLDRWSLNQVTSE